MSRDKNVANKVDKRFRHLKRLLTGDAPTEFEEILRQARSELSTLNEYEDKKKDKVIMDKSETQLYEWLKEVPVLEPEFDQDTDEENSVPEVYTGD